MWGPHLGGLSFFGSGQYSGNIIQGGVALQPQDYLLDGVTPLARCIVVTNTATVAPHAETGASAAMGTNLVVIGASASLSPSTNAKALVLVFRRGIYLRSGGVIHADRLGKAGGFGNLTPISLVPLALRRRINTRRHAAYIMSGEGAAGGPSVTTPPSVVGGVTGSAAGAMQTGGGGSGGVVSNYAQTTSGPGGSGGPCCGGAGGGSTPKHSTDGSVICAAGPHGGPGGNGIGMGNTDPAATWGAGAGAGDPVGTSTNPGISPPIVDPAGAGGAPVWAIAPVVDIASGCRLSSDGAQGGYVSAGIDFGLGGGGAGGGLVGIITKPGGYSNAGTVRAAGGLGGLGYGGIGKVGGPGGAGSVNIFSAAA